MTIAARSSASNNAHVVKAIFKLKNLYHSNLHLLLQSLNHMVQRKGADIGEGSLFQFFSMVVIII
jgi:hypothetical protein